MLSGFAHLFRTGNSNLITYKLSTSVKVSNAELSHASKSTVARHQRNRAGAQNKGFFGAVIWPISAIFSAHVSHRVCGLEVGCLQRTTYYRAPVSWFEIAEKPWSKQPHENPSLHKAFQYLFRVQVGLAT